MENVKFKQQTNSMNKLNSFINISELKDIVSNDKNLILELIDVFVSEYPKQLNEIQIALTKNDVLLLEKAAHKFKGTLVSLTMAHPADLAFKIEKMAKVSQFNKAKKTFQKLIKEIDDINQFLSNKKWEKYI